MKILFLNENPLPKTFTKGSIAGKELRLRAAISDIAEIHAISLPGKTVQVENCDIGELESKIYIHHTIKFPYYFSSLILFLYGFYYALKLKPNTIEAESPLFSGPAAILIGKLLKIKTIVEVRASYHELAKLKLTIIPVSIKLALISAITKLVYKNSSAIIANSKYYHSQLKDIGFSSTIINPGVQFDIPKTLPPKQKIIGFIGRLVPEKGVEYLIRSVSDLKNLLLKKHYHVEIIGEGIELKSLRKLVKSLDLNNLIKFNGIESAKIALSRFSILVNPCFVKPPLEMINAEAAAMGVPVICFGGNGIPETVLAEKSGIIIPYLNQNLLTQAIKSLVDDQDKISLLSNMSQNFAKQNYDFTTQVDSLRRVYQQQGLF